MDAGTLHLIVATQAFFTALTLGFGLLHVILYAFHREQRSNLFYALFLFAYAASLYLDFETIIVESDDVETLLLRFHRLTVAVFVAFSLRFIYELFLDQLPARFWVFSAAAAATGALSVVEPRQFFWMVQIVLAAAFLESLRVTLQAARRSRIGAWIIAAGFGVFAVFAGYDLLLDFRVMDPVAGITNAYQFGSIGLFIATSIYLARDIARTRGRLLEEQQRAQEVEMDRRLLRADVERKTRELEEARDLQLSMLPTQFPDVPGLLVAASMETATEVGGDYYDFRIGNQGELTVAIGDATGHGLKAGILVSITKSLFHSHADFDDIPAFFESTTRVLKQLHLGNLFMAMTLMRFHNGTLAVSAAGIPPLLIYRHATGEIEEARMKGMPLGAFDAFPYERSCLKVGAGDTVLAMTDGFMELPDPNGQRLGWTRARDTFHATASATPAQIINHLRKAAAQWRVDGPPEDDMTFVVVKLT